MSKKSDKLTVDKATIWQGVSVILGILLLISIFTGGFGTNIGSTESNVDAKGLPYDKKEQIPADKQAQPIDESDPMVKLMDDDDIKGNPDATVTIVEWSDFECPFCVRFYNQAYADIVKEYIDTGKVKLVFRDYPLNFHKNAQKAAEAAECAGEQEKYYDMHDKLFEEGVSGGVSSFKQFAADLELNTDEFNNCLDSGKMADEVAKDMRDGQAAGIRGTPGFIINGQLVSGAQPFASFQQIIEAELAK